MAAGAVPGWEPEARYRDPQEVLEAAGPPAPCGPEQAAPVAELRGPQSGAGPAPGAASTGGSPPREASAAAARRGAKRRRCGERGSERRAQELTAQNERLRAEIQRLSAEVRRARAALIDRIVNLRRA